MIGGAAARPARAGRIFGTLEASPAERAGGLEWRVERPVRPLDRGPCARIAGARAAEVELPTGRGARCRESVDARADLVLGLVLSGAADHRSARSTPA